jgi:hypothetical protein
MNVIFVTAAYALEPSGGGVQRCTREYLTLLRAAGCDVTLKEYEIDRRPVTRLRRFLVPRPYADLIHPGVAEEVAEAAIQAKADWILFNQTEAGALAPQLRSAKTAGIRLGLLSHGTDSADFLHNLRITADGIATMVRRNSGALWLGRQLIAEMNFHRHCDLVFCLSETDRQLAQWLGGTCVHVLPRAVESTPLRWQPVAGRIGMVSTLNHGPNLEGLELFCRAIPPSAPAEFRLRLVGRPPEIGRALASRFPFVDYLGGLSDTELAAEACTWCGFANPIFCYPRGSSTKLAVPLSWRLPVVTTRAGARGYEWDESLVPLCETPDDFAAAAIHLANPDQARAAYPAHAALADRSPTISKIAETVRTALT